MLRCCVFASFSSLTELFPSSFSLVLPLTDAIDESPAAETSVSPASVFGAASLPSILLSIPFASEVLDSDGSAESDLSSVFLGPLPPSAWVEH